MFISARLPTKDLCIFWETLVAVVSPIVERCFALKGPGRRPTLYIGYQHYAWGERYILFLRLVGAFSLASPLSLIRLVS